MEKKDANLTMLATKLNAETAEAFKELAAKNDTTVSRMLSNYIRVTLEDAREKPLKGYLHLVSYENTDRLKHEVAFHNPNHMNPDQMLNHILDNYFKMVAEVRKTSR